MPTAYEVEVLQKVRSVLMSHDPLLGAHGSPTVVDVSLPGAYPTTEIVVTMPEADVTGISTQVFPIFSRGYPGGELMPDPASIAVVIYTAIVD